MILSLYEEQNRNDVKSVSDVLAYVALNNINNLPSLESEYNKHSDTYEVSDNLRSSSKNYFMKSIPGFSRLGFLHFILLIALELPLNIAAQKISKAYLNATGPLAKIFFGVLNLFIAQPLFALANIITNSRIILDSLNPLNFLSSPPYSMKKLVVGVTGLIPAAIGVALYSYPPVGAFVNAALPVVSPVVSYVAAAAASVVGSQWIRQALDVCCFWKRPQGKVVMDDFNLDKEPNAVRSSKHSVGESRSYSEKNDLSGNQSFDGVVGSYKSSPAIASMLQDSVGDDDVFDQSVGQQVKTDPKSLKKLEGSFENNPYAFQLTVDEISGGSSTFLQTAV